MLSGEEESVPIAAYRNLLWLSPTRGLFVKRCGVVWRWGVEQCIMIETGVTQLVVALRERNFVRLALDIQRKTI